MKINSDLEFAKWWLVEGLARLTDDGQECDLLRNIQGGYRLV